MSRTALLRHTSHLPVFIRLHRSAPVCLLGWIWPKRQRTAPMGRKLQRSFEELHNGLSTTESQQIGLTVLQWNVLADGLAQYGDFEKVPRVVLDWETRSPMLLEEILESQADIICLQEVNRYEEFFRPQLQRAGFTGLFWPKACSPAEQYGFPCDGCALFFASERFEMLGPPCGQPFNVAGGPSGKQGMLHVLLRDRRSGQRILAATTHLKAKGGQANEAAREVQAEQMMARLASAAQASCRQLQQQGSNGAQPVAGTQQEQQQPLVLLCGDFNDTPASPACRVVREHGLGLCSTWDADEQEEPASSSPGNGASPARASTLGDEGRALFTTWKFRPDGVSQRTIDFIWFSRDPRLRLLRRWRMPGEAEIGPRGLPCERYPSDHLALCAVFRLLPDAD